MACETDVRVQNECAVRCSIASKPVHTLEYVKTISSLVGASHILAVFEENDSIKVFFDDKRSVDTLIRSCLHVLGHHVNVDYVIPPGVKLTLSNVDPVITNYDIMRLLAAYGTVVSPVIRPPISNDVELCHISYGVRYVYMVLTGCIPERVEFRYGDQLSYFKVSLGENTSFILPCIKTDASPENLDESESNSTVQSRDSVPGPSDTETLPAEEAVDPVLVSVQSVPAVNSKEQLDSSNFNYQTTLDFSAVSKELSSEDNKPQVVVKKRPGRPPLARRKRLVAVSQAARRIKNAKQKWLKDYKKTKCGRKAIRKSYFHKRQVSSDTCMDMPDLVKISEQDTSGENNASDILDIKDLRMYIREVKGHRAPLELARKYIGENCDSGKVFRLIEQLRKFKKSQANINLKSRIWRLNKTLADALDSENREKEMLLQKL